MIKRWMPLMFVAALAAPLAGCFDSEVERPGGGGGAVEEHEAPAELDEGERERVGPRGPARTVPQEDGLREPIGPAGE